MFLNYSDNLNLPSTQRAGIRQTRLPVNAGSTFGEMLYGARKVRPAGRGSHVLILRQQRATLPELAHGTQREGIAICLASGWERTRAGLPRTSFSSATGPRETAKVSSSPNILCLRESNGQIDVHCARLKMISTRSEGVIYPLCPGSRHSFTPGIQRATHLSAHAPLFYHL